MIRLARTTFALLAVAVAAANGSAVFAAQAPVPVRLIIDGRPVLRATALARSGVVYVELGGIVRTFSGLVIFDHATATVSVGNRVAIFTVGSARANLDGEVLAIGGKTFAYNGDLYVPLGFFATRVARAKVSIGSGGTIAYITSGPSVTSALPTATP